jgi:exopolysaccharide production protein ExoQ
VLQSPSLPRPDLGDRRTRLVLGTTVLGALIAAFVYTIGTGDVRLTLLVAGVAVAPALLVLALKRSYLFPYGLYVVLVPFDNMLKISGAGTLTKMLGIASTIFIIIYAVRRKGLNKPPLAMYFWCAYMAWTLLSAMWTVNVGEAMIDVQQTFSLVLMYAVLAVAPVEERDVRAICACLVFGGIAASIYGMYLLHESPVLATGGDHGRLMINVANRTIDPNHFANSMLAPLAIALVGLLNSRKVSHALFSAAAIVILTAGILMSVSREALLACVVIAATLVWFSRRRLLGLLIGIPVLAAVPLVFPAVAARMADAASSGGAGRTGIWHIGFLAWKAHPVIGWGAGGALDAFDKYYLNVYQLYTTGWTRPPHNTPLHAAIELGLVGLSLMLLGYLSMFRLFKGIRRGDRLYDVRVALTASLLALGFCSLFIDLANYKYVWLVFGTIAQMASVARMQRMAAAPRAVYEPPPPPVARPVVRGAIPVRS